jgi:hypothetical protein
MIGLMKVDWNNNTLYKRLPVTLVYSKEFAENSQQVPGVVESTFDLRKLM